MPAPDDSASAAPDVLTADVVRRAQAGDAGAFESVYHAHAGRVFALCLRMAADRRRATELAQDVFVRLWEKLPQFRFESAFATWLHRLAVTTVLEHFRAEHRREARVAFSGENTFDAPLPARGLSLDDRIDLEQALTKLATAPRQVFVLHEVEGFSHDEIATMTGIAAATVRVHLHRARKQLLKEMNA